MKNNFGGWNDLLPEDRGGIHGYDRLQQILNDPSYPDHEDKKNWLGEKYNQDHFNSGEIKFDYPYKLWKRAFLDD
ncbi:MAG: hypothetical protein WD052_07860 [Bacteroidales bacterium]